MTKRPDSRTEEDDGEGDRFEPPALLNFWQRAALVWAAIFCAIVGIGGMFKTSNEGGTTVLVTGALAFLFLAILGQVPLRGSFGSLSWDLTRRLMHSRDPKVAAATAQQVLVEARRKNVPDDVLASARRTIQDASLKYERDVLAGLSRLGRRRGWRVEVPRPQQSGFRPDAAVVAGEATVLVEIKYGGVSTPYGTVARWYKQIFGLYHSYRQQQGEAVRGILLVTPPLSQEAVARLASLEDAAPGMSSAEWYGPDDDEALATAIDRMLHRPTA